MMLEEDFGGLSLALLLHEHKTTTAKNGLRYSTPMKKFAKTLYFYSPRAFLSMYALNLCFHITQLLKVG